MFSKTFDGQKVPDEDIEIYICSIVSNHPSYGSRRIAYELKTKFNIKIGRKKVLKLCKKLNFSKPRKSSKRNIQRKAVQVYAPNTHWQVDITYIPLNLPMKERPSTLMLLAILDTYTSEIVHYTISKDMRTEKVIKTIKQAMEKRNLKQITIRTDNGTQFVSNEFKEFCKEKGIVHERIPIREPEKNGHIERFFRTLKEELVNPNVYENEIEFAIWLNKYIEYYNNQRPHMRHRGISPKEYRQKIEQREIEAKVYVLR